MDFIDFVVLVAPHYDWYWVEQNSSLEIQVCEASRKWIQEMLEVMICSELRVNTNFHFLVMAH
jgi:hypothetical protein